MTTLPPGDDDPPDPTPAPRRNLKCEFCGCSLSAHGEVLKLSEQAKSWRDGDGQADKLQKQIAAHETTIADLKTKLETASKPPARSAEREYLI